VKFGRTFQVSLAKKSYPPRCPEMFCSKPERCYCREPTRGDAAQKFPSRSGQFFQTTGYSSCEDELAAHQRVDADVPPVHATQVNNARERMVPANLGERVGYLEGIHRTRLWVSVVGAETVVTGKVEIGNTDLDARQTVDPLLSMRGSFNATSESSAAARASCGTPGSASSVAS
jgi:hypothetical protein